MKFNKILIGLSYVAIPLIFSSSSLAQTGNPGLDAELRGAGDLGSEVDIFIDESQAEIQRQEEEYQVLEYKCNELNDQEACLEKRKWDRHRRYREERWRNDQTGL